MIDHFHSTSLQTQRSVFPIFMELFREAVLCDCGCLRKIDSLLMAMKTGPKSQGALRISFLKMIWF